MTLRFAVLPVCVLALSGCSLFPQPSHLPSVHNPFPQLSKIAVCPFFNQTMEPTLDCRMVANAYFHELQSVPGFEVVPVATVETTMLTRHLTLNSATDARRLAQILQVDAVVTGAVTDFSPYYPPRMAMQVEWYAANPGFHPIPPGYGLPWGTHEEQEIPHSLVFEAQFALAKEQMKTQTPPYAPLPPVAAPPGQEARKICDHTVQPVSAELPASGGKKGTAAATAADDKVVIKPPPVWPDPRGFIPPPPQPYPPQSCPSDAPVLRHTRTYIGNDAEFTAALANYHESRDDARFDGWQGYLQRSDEFIRFCCHLHIWEMLTARGGAGETRVVWHWPTVR